MNSQDELIASALRGEGPGWPRDWSPDDAERVRERAEFHGVQGLLYLQVQTTDWPAQLLQALRTDAFQRAMWELRHQQLLAQLLPALQGIGVEPVLFKGTALAHSLYADPALRSRGDTDLIIAAGDKNRVHDKLTALGYSRELGVSGDFVSYQATYTRHVDGSAHSLDLHWKIANSQLLSKLFSYAEMRRDAQPLASLCQGALGPSPVNSFLVACMHRSGHKQAPYYVRREPHYDADRLIWLYDIHLLAGRLAPSQWQELVRLATEKGLRAICLDGMRHTQACFGTTYPADVLQALEQSGFEAPAIYLDGGRLRQQWMDFRALGGAGARLNFIRELLFPSPAYMRMKFGTSAGGLPWLYFRRACRGILKRLGAPRANP